MYLFSLIMYALNQKKRVPKQSHITSQQDRKCIDNRRSLPRVFPTFLFR